MLLQTTVFALKKDRKRKMEKNKETLHVLRHSCSHIMAQAVQKLFPQAKLAIGPATDAGFYYDFDLTDGYAFTQDDLAKIEEEMKNIVQAFIHNFYEGGRHDRRLSKIRDIENMNIEGR